MTFTPAPDRDAVRRIVASEIGAAAASAPLVHQVDADGNYVDIYMNEETRQLDSVGATPSGRLVTVLVQSSSAGPYLTTDQVVDLVKGLLAGPG